jgi:hypothetical protein
MECTDCSHACMQPLPMCRLSAGILNKFMWCAAEGLCARPGVKGRPPQMIHSYLRRPVTSFQVSILCVGCIMFVYLLLCFTCFACPSYPSLALKYILFTVQCMSGKRSKLEVMKLPQRLSRRHGMPSWQRQSFSLTRWVCSRRGSTTAFSHSAIR